MNARTAAGRKACGRTLLLPLAKPLPSAANLREHWATKAKRVKAQRVAVSVLLHGARGDLRELGFPAKAARMSVTLTRVAARELDDDNLASAFKAVRDQIASHFGVDDGSPRWSWSYRQTKGEPAILIRLEVAP